MQSLCKSLMCIQPATCTGIMSCSEQCTEVYVALEILLARAAISYQYCNFYYSEDRLFQLDGHKYENFQFYRSHAVPHCPEQTI